MLRSGVLAIVFLLLAACAAPSKDAQLTRNRSEQQLPDAGTKAEPTRPPLSGRAQYVFDQESNPTPESASMAFDPSGTRFLLEEPGHRIGVWNVASGERERMLDAPGDVRKITFTPEGARVGVVTHLAVVMFELASGRVLFARKHPSSGPLRASFSPDGTKLALIGLDGTLEVLDVATGAKRLVGKAGRSAHVIGFSTSGDRVLTRLRFQERIWDVASARLLAEYGPDAVFLSPDARTRIVVEEGTFRFVDVETNRVRATHAVKGTASFQGFAGPVKVNGVAVSPDSKHAVVCYDPASANGLHLTAQHLALFDVSTGRKLGMFKRRAAGCQALSFVSAARFVAAIEGGGFELWSIGERRPLGSLPLEYPPLAAHVWSPDANLVARLAAARNRVEVVSRAGDPKLFASVTPMPAPSQTPARAVVGGAFDSQALRLALIASGEDSTPMIWAPQRDRVERMSPFRGSDRPLVELGPGGLVVQPDDNGAWLYSSSSSRPIALDAANSSLSPDGTQIAVISSFGLVLHDARNGRALRTLSADGVVGKPIWRADGQRLAVTSGQNVVTFDTRRARRVSAVLGSEPIAFAPDGSIFVRSSGGSVAWHEAGGKLRSLISISNEDRVVCAPDGRRILVGSALIDPVTQKAVAFVPIDGRAPAVFDANGKRLATIACAETCSSTSDALSIWNVDDGTLLSDLVVPPGAVPLGFAGDRWLTLLTRTGGMVLSLDTGRSLRLDLPGGGQKTVRALDTGHFDAPDTLSSHVRVMLEGFAKGETPGIFTRGPEWESFRRAKLERDFFTSK